MYLLFSYDKALENSMSATGRHPTSQYPFTFTFLSWLRVFLRFHAGRFIICFLRIHEPLFANSVIIYDSNY